ncbi:MAG: DNA polymerase Y family protein [Gammaproteobacteria bacterium]
MLNCLFIDFDAYFASVEQELRPELRGRPVGVVPVMADTTCCIAASYEAKRLGVTTGTGVGEAKKRCPGIALVEARHELYVQYHHRLRAAVESRIPVDAVASIDELACTLTGSWREPERARAVALEVQAAVAEIGEHIGCSIGIAPNRFLAKMASKMDKPRGLRILDDADIPQALYDLELGDLTGIGRRMRVRLQAAGINTVEQLYAAPRRELAQIWGGIGGERMYGELRGKEYALHSGPRASIGHSHVLAPELRTPPAALAVLHRLLQKSAWRLRSLGYAAGSVRLSLRYLDGEHWSQAERFAPSADTGVLEHVMGTLWERRPAHSAPVLGVGVSLSRLSEWAQGSLFEEGGKRSRLNQTVDSVNDRFGAQAVYFGGAHSALDAAPMRIAFTHIPDPKLEK